MDVDSIIPIVLFLCITYAIKMIVDARMRSRLVGSGASDELLRSLLEGEERQRRFASLRWGITLIALGIAFGLIEAFGWRDVTPGLLAVLAIATGAGNLVFYAISRRLS